MTTLTKGARVLDKRDRQVGTVTGVGDYGINVRMDIMERGDFIVSRHFRTEGLLEPVTDNVVRYLAWAGLPRQYAIGPTAIVTCINEDEWDYRCSCGTEPCEHVGLVMEARAEFEKADEAMGDASQ